MSGSSRTLDDLRNLYQTRKGFDSQQTTKFFDSWAATYDEDMETLKYREPQVLVDFLNANFSGSREEVQVLDVACGSGLVAKMMAELGFRHFVGVDGSKNMLDQAAKSGLYQDLKLALLGTEPLPAQTGAFDVVIIVGALRECSVPVSVVRELYQATKPGGYVCMTRVDTKTESGKEYKVSLEKELQLMEEEALWVKVDTKQENNYLLDPFNRHEKEQKEQYIGGSIYMYKSLK
ncbi:methyltransferase-like protein 27 [Epinephelus fuscoguttatus]|uniref:methyltransferase-like protein 27 n=1 Tax=Epinephelus fuscoguttatus TaxID=293821 RepID=UPI0020D0D9E1|nr:methyltransferase-like protein 27 [Epinephelus fuscoguttatus]